MSVARLSDVLCALCCTVHFVVCSVLLPGCDQCAVLSLCSVQCAVCSVHCLVTSVQCAVQWLVCSVQCAVARCVVYHRPLQAVAYISAFASSPQSSMLFFSNNVPNLLEPLVQPMGSLQSSCLTFQTKEIVILLMPQLRVNFTAHDCNSWVLKTQCNARLSQTESWGTRIIFQYFNISIFPSSISSSW